MQRTDEQLASSPKAGTHERAERRARVLICVLASAAGCTDAVNYLALGHVFTANMTGNTVLLGIAIVSGFGSQVVRSGCALVGYCAGVAFGARFLASAPVTVWPPRATRLLAIEALTLSILGICGALFGLGSGRTDGWIVASGIAMGMQSAAVCVIGVPGVATTYITGTLTHMIMGTVGRVNTAWYSAQGGRRGTSVVAASIWGVYLAAALAGAAAAMAIGVRAIWIAAAIVASVSAAAAFCARADR